MIQRIQSLWLLLTSLSMLLLFFLPIARFQPDPNIANAHGVAFSFNLYELHYEHEDFSSAIVGDLYAPLLKYTMIIVAIVCIVSPLFSIFRYKKRPQQLLLAKWTMLMNALIMVALFLLADFFAKQTYTTISYKTGIYLPCIAIVFLFLAIRSIRKDERLVRSADRIR